MGNCFCCHEDYDDLPPTTKIIYDVYQKLRQRGLSKPAAIVRTSQLTEIPQEEIHKIIPAEQLRRLIRERE